MDNWWRIVAFVLSISPTLSGYTWDRTSSGLRLPPPNQHVAASPPSMTPPEFDEVLIREIQAKRGETIVLPCTVNNLGDKVVSWIRSEDLHILTSATNTFSADNRFEPVHNTRTNFWGLRIRGVKYSDTGRYECQVNTDPKMSLAINLTVADFAPSPSNSAYYLSYKWSNVAAIKGPAEVYIREGSSATFTCEISASSPSFAPPAPQSPPAAAPRAPRHIHWLHDVRQISFDTYRGGISVETDYRDRNSVSRLRVAEVSPQDRGLYTCTQASTRPASVRLFVTEAEHSEAMQRDAPHSSVSSSKRRRTCYLLPPIVLYLAHRIRSLG